MPKYFYQNKEVEVIKITSGGIALLADKRWVSMAMLQIREDKVGKVKKPKAAIAQEVSDVLPE